MNQRSFQLWLPSFLLAIGILTASCGSQVARTAGSIQGSVEWSGTWPASNNILVALFTVAPWNDDFHPGPPAAFRMIYQPAGQQIQFSIEQPQVAFGTYQALMIAWRDPDDTNPSSQMRMVSIYGTTIDQAQSANPIVLDEAHPDASGLVMPPVILYKSNEDMRTQYPSLGSGT